MTILPSFDMVAPCGWSVFAMRAQPNLARSSTAASSICRRGLIALAAPARGHRGQGVGASWRPRPRGGRRSQIRGRRASIRSSPTPTRSSASASAIEPCRRGRPELPTVPSVCSRLDNTLVPHGGDIVRPRASIDSTRGRARDRDRRALPARAARQRARGRGGLHLLLRRQRARLPEALDNRGQELPATGPLGPWMVTADVVADPQRLEITTRLNGKACSRHDRSHDLRCRHHHRVSLDRGLAGAG